MGAYLPDRHYRSRGSHVTPASACGSSEFKAESITDPKRLNRSDLEEARVSSAVAHALSVEKTRSEELAAKLARSEADNAAHSEAARLAQGELRIKERELQSAGAEMGLAFIARDNAIEDAKEARKAEAARFRVVSAFSCGHGYSEQFDPRVWLDFSDPKWDRARSQLQGLVDHCLDPSLQRKRPELGSYRERTGHYHSDISLRPKIFLRGFDTHSLVVCPQLIVRTFARVVDGRRESQSASNFEVCWQVLGLRSSSLFARFLGSSTGDVSPRVRAISRSRPFKTETRRQVRSHVFLGRRRAT
ncbi:hypothetical protein PanWU01x14_255480 [Parasponia andersonii]|uniref:Uncharacterized protein n=1 Tax=Parasponia andersonii TaxID=3476 RepID=A0A2P5BAT6_PARAD|nr:hypothetical protein PanWU01x14_255480 [Parasponia andersonii]